jgi:hypothetical protein
LEGPYHSSAKPFGIGREPFIVIPFFCIRRPNSNLAAIDRRGIGRIRERSPRAPAEAVESCG